MQEMEPENKVLVRSFSKCSGAMGTLPSPPAHQAKTIVCHFISPFGLLNCRSSLSRSRAWREIFDED
jgi:hypothetical protein